MLGKLRKLFILSFISLGFFFMGYIVHRQEYFPSHTIEKIGKGLKAYFGKKWYYQPATEATKVPIQSQGALNWPAIVTSIGPEDSLNVKIINNTGQVFHKWSLEWFDIWSDAIHVPDDRMPRSRPGSMIHGVELIEDGSIVFNFENLGLVRVDKYGKLIWKLPYLTHHSITRDKDVLWVCGQQIITKHDDRFPNYRPPFIEPMLLKVSLEGEVLEVISVLDIFLENNLYGFLAMPTTADLNTVLSGDIMHLNDVEPFPEEFEEGYFTKGDILISVRNINTILIYNLTSKTLKNVLTGDFVRQHDPDFIDGNTLSIYDNYNIGSQNPNTQSRIIKLTLPDEVMEVYYHGNEEQPFNSNIMGKHQWLENGNLLITDPMNGRAFEINGQKEIVWEYINLISGQRKGVVQEVTRIPDSTMVAFD